jgi:bacteriocin biosynthesis cyclodehydratase domain-containing protein
MKYKSKNWNIKQSDVNEYILLSDSNTIKKIKGKNASDIISVLLNIQNSETKIEFKEIFLIDRFEKNYTSDITDWLLFNNFIYVENTLEQKINIVGEFGNDENLIAQLVNKFPKNITINKLYNLSITNILDNYNDNVFTLIIAPLYYNANNVKIISELQLKSQSDFLYVELYENGILVGPLMNSQKETVCLNCIEKRRVFNATNPDIIIENLISKDDKSIIINNIFEIGNFDINCAFIINEIQKILFFNKKTMYNKSIFIDYSNYENQLFELMKAPNCEICNNLTVYNPL